MGRDGKKPQPEMQLQSLKINSETPMTIHKPFLHLRDVFAVNKSMATCLHNNEIK